jgi:SAM-dependent methyltransferase
MSAVTTTIHAATPQRIRHPALYVYFFGGIVGSGINLLLTMALHRWMGLSGPLAFYLGTLANELFHHVYYHWAYVNREIRLRTPLALQVILYLLVAGAAALLMAVLLRLGLGFIASLMLSLAILAIANSLINRISTFSSSELAMVEYQEMGESFYDDQTDRQKVNFVRAWFHRSRFEHLTRFVDRHYRPGMALADLGCGNCWWNVNGYPVIGVDVNEPMMRWAKQHGRLADYRVANDLSHTGLPDASFDIVLMSETLEHLLNLDATVAEVRRILKPGGTFLITVPYDFFLGPFFVLFNVNCLWQGYVRGSVYHRYRCGHINHFTRQRLREVLRHAGFEVAEMKVVNGMSLYAAAGKQKG